MLKIEYVRDGKYQIIGKKTSGLAAGGTVAHDAHGKILGRSSESLHHHQGREGRVDQCQSGRRQHAIRLVSEGARWLQRAPEERLAAAIRYTCREFRD
jgi:hypothetical protein